MKVPELQNFLEARDMHSKSCGWKGKEKGRTTMKLCKNEAEMTSFRRTLFSIFNLATFLTSSSISSWSMSVWQEAETDLFYRVYLFFQLVKNWLCCPYTEKYSRDPSKRHQTTHGDFSPETSDRFHCFSPSDIILLVHSDLLWVEYRWKRPVYYLFYPSQGLHDFFGVEMLRTYVLVAVDWNSCQLAGKRCSISFEAFSYSEVRKSWGMVAFWNCFFTRKWHNTSNLSVLLSK